MSTATRPDIAAAVGVLSQYLSKPSKDHWMGVQRVLRYLEGTLNYGLKFSVHGEQTELNGYSDADWVGDVDTRRPTSAYVFQFGSGTISWSSRKQPTVAKSSTEAEYVALSSATQKAIWLRRLMKDFGKQMGAPTTSMKTTKEPLSWQRMPNTIAELSTLAFVIILFEKELFLMKLE